MAAPIEPRFSQPRVRPGRDTRPVSFPSSSSSVQRVSDEPRRWRIFASGTTVPTSWTTVITGAKSAAIKSSKQKTVITWVSFVSTDGSDYTLQIRLQDPAGTSYEIAQAQLVEDGEQWRPMKEVTAVPIPPGWLVQIIGSGAGTVNVHWVFAGYEEVTE